MILLTVVLAALKLMGYLFISWPWVLAPAILRVGWVALDVMLQGH